MISISCHSSINGHGSVLERSKTVPRGAQGGARMSTSEPPLAPRGAPRKPATGPNKVPIWLHDASRWRQYWPRCCPKTVPSSNTGLLLFLPLLMLLLMLFLLHPIPPPCEGGSSMGGVSRSPLQKYTMGRFQKTIYQKFRRRRLAFGAARKHPTHRRSPASLLLWGGPGEPFTYDRSRQGYLETSDTPSG